MLLCNRRFLIFCLISTSVSLTYSLQGPIETEQNTRGLSLGGLVVQIVTEPENLIRLFESLDLGFQIFKSWGKAGAGLISLPLKEDLLRGRYDPFPVDAHRKLFYARVPTRSSHEAPRFLKLTADETHKRFNLDSVNRLFQRKKDEAQTPFSNHIESDLLGHESMDIMAHNVLSQDDVIQLRRKRSTGEESTLSGIIPLLLKRPSLNKEQIEKVVDFLNKALGFLDEYADAL